MERSAERERILMGAIGVSVALRLAAAVYLGNSVAPLPGIFDQVSYHTLAVRVLDGYGFTFPTGWWPATEANQPTAFWSFLYVLFLTGIYEIAGPYPLAARLVQAVAVGILQPLLTYRIALRLFGRSVALVAAGIVSFYVYFVYYAAALLTEPFFIAALLYAIDRAMALADTARSPVRDSGRLWLQLGVALAAAVLLRQVVVVVVPFILLWTWWKARVERPGTSTRHAALAVLIIAAAVVPWTVRNYVAFREFVPLNTNAGFTFYWGNHPVHGASFTPIMPPPRYGDLIPSELRGLNEAQLDRALIRRGLGFIAAAPVRFVRLSSSRVREFVKFWPSRHSGAVSNYSRVLSFGVCLPFMVAGVIVGARRAPSRTWFVLGIGAIYSLVHLLTWTLVRYRLAVDALLMPFAALAIAGISQQLLAWPGAHPRAEAAASSPRLSRYPLGSQRLVLLAWTVFSDALALGAAFALAYWVRFSLQITVAPEVVAPAAFYLLLTASLIALWLLVFVPFNLYELHSRSGGSVESARVFNACTLAAMLVVVATFLVPTFVISRVWLISAWGLSFLFVAGNRFVLRRLVRVFRSRGYLIAPAVIVGTNEEAQNLAAALRDWQASGVVPEGFVATNGHGGAGEAGLPVLGSIADIAAIVRRHGIEEVVVAITSLSREELLRLCEDVDPLAVELRLSSGLYELLTTRVSVRTIGSVPLMSLQKTRLDRREAVVKGVLERSLALIGLVVLAPLMAVIALAIALDARGPVIYRRRVLGAGGHQFDAFKFRTMFVNGDEILSQRPEAARELSVNHKLKDDPRITRVGRWLRKYSLDEIPQLANVLLGQMALVGPRMITVEEARNYGRHRMNLLTVKPGITGLWQVSGRSNLSYEERVRIDMYYVRNYSIWLDLQILFIQTPPAVLGGKGAY